MKKTLRCLLSLVLAIALVFALVPSVSAEKTDDVVTMGDMVPVSDESVYEAPGYKDLGTYWNPDVGDVPRGQFTDRDVPDAEAEPGRGFVYNDSTPKEAVLSYIRSKLKAREATVIITYETSKSYDHSAYSKQIFRDALEHTGVPTEGDYLRRHWDGWSGMRWNYPGVRVVYLYEVKYFTTAAQEKEMDVAVPALLKSLNLNGCTDYQKIFKIYDWMCHNITYDYDGLELGPDLSPQTWSAYKALIKGTAVCQGYASLFYRLALECGIDCRYISGFGNGGSHGWNIVKLGNYYYNVDATWDAPYAKYDMKYPYFLRTDNTFGDHVRGDDYNTTAFYAKYPMAPTDYVPGKTVAGDMDGNEVLNTDDAVHLLLNVMFGDAYYDIPSAVRRDTNGDNKINTDDAVHLLLHVMFGASYYPLAA